MSRRRNGGAVRYAGVVGVEPPDFKAQSSLRTPNIFMSLKD